MNNTDTYPLESTRKKIKKIFLSSFYRVVPLLLTSFPSLPQEKDQQCKRKREFIKWNGIPSAQHIHHWQSTQTSKRQQSEHEMIAFSTWHCLFLSVKDKWNVPQGEERLTWFMKRNIFYKFYFRFEAISIIITTEDICLNKVWRIKMVDMLRFFANTILHLRVHDNKMIFFHL
jgi:hypothetical protein